MITPRRQWCIQIEVTNACPFKCSNCTRLTAHVREPFFLSPGDFDQALAAVAAFPTESELCHPAGDPPGRKVIGMMGGEPLVHPDFEQLCEVMVERMPNRNHRGLWTALPFGKRSDLIAKTFGYVNRNQHDRECRHQPILVAVQEVIPDRGYMWRLIDACPLQRKWASAITPKGFFFCEVAATLDLIFDGPGGKPIDPECWRLPVEAYRDQVERWCPRCGMCLPLPGRRDKEKRDDITPGNLEELKRLGSPRAVAGNVVVFDPATYNQTEHAKEWKPLKYLQ